MGDFKLVNCIKYYILKPITHNYFPTNPNLC